MRVVAKIDAVRNSIAVLSAARIHPAFVGYLSLLRAGAQVGRLTNIKWDYTEFFKTFLKIDGGPAKKPYFRPFWNEEETTLKMWYQRNVAGTYSPVSARRIEAFMNVVSVQGEGTLGRYSLKARHWELARTNLTNAQRVPLIPVIAFLYRDYAFESDGPIGFDNLISAFQYEFGFTPDVDPSWETSFSHLFVVNAIGNTFADWFEVT